ncbi:MAG TPA: ZIP family metal transporter [Solirubrobacteraceae bacterium]|jgi:ZIP family zinc transporter|nr:ZIP family metal transporter [Solirubrobacteraceae bacterium]
MSFAETILLGAIAGATIFIGLPVGRMDGLGERARLALSMLSVGILAFIFMDVTAHGEAIVADAVHHYKSAESGLGHVFALFALLAAGFTVGTAGIATIERRIRPERPTKPPIAGGEAAAEISTTELRQYEDQALSAQRATLRFGMTIAVAIGLHNFAEGLAIGVSAQTGAIGLATVLIIGFALHNATEGFGIVGPLGSVKPSWRWLALAGLVAGGPTLLGTIVGYQVHSEALELAFYGLAGGAIIYVIGEVWTIMRRHGHRELGLYMLSLGFLIGVATDLVVTYGGA